MSYPMARAINKHYNPTSQEGARRWIKTTDFHYLKLTSPCPSLNTWIRNVKTGRPWSWAATHQFGYCPLWKIYCTATDNLYSQSGYNNDSENQIYRWSLPPSWSQILLLLFYRPKWWFPAPDRDTMLQYITQKYIVTCCAFDSTTTQTAHPSLRLINWNQGLGTKETWLQKGQCGVLELYCPAWLALHSL